jgi:YhcH/YjgK/YiaL family protein
MIADRLENAKLYVGLGTRLAKAFEHLARLAAAVPADGKLELEGKDVYAIVQSYETKPAAEKKWEAHRNYIDIQYVAEGVEAMTWAPIQKLTPAADYSPEKDVVNFKPAAGSPVVVEKGSFAVFFPEDGHQPGVQSGAASVKVRKIVVKVKV